MSYQRVANQTTRMAMVKKKVACPPVTDWPKAYPQFGRLPLNIYFILSPLELAESYVQGGFVMNNPQDIYSYDIILYYPRLYHCMPICITIHMRNCIDLHANNPFPLPTNVVGKVGGVILYFCFCSVSFLWVLFVSNIFPLF